MDLAQVLGMGEGMGKAGLAKHAARCGMRLYRSALLPLKA